MRSRTIEGIAPKPDYCLTGCPLGTRATGFVADKCGPKARIGLLMSQPTKKEALERSPTASYGSFFWQTVLKKNGLSEAEFGFFHVLRCNGYSYPIGFSRTQSESACREWDDSCRDEQGGPSGRNGLRSFGPDLFMVTFDFASAMELEAYQSLLCNDVQKALRFSATLNPRTQRPFRPLLLMGTEPMDLVAPWLTRAGGGVKRWRGHWWEGYWPYAAQASPAPPTYEKPLTPLLRISQAVKPAATEQKAFDFGTEISVR